MRTRAGQSVATVQCPLCGYTYGTDEAQAACTGCPLKGSCGLLRCPNCSYETPAAGARHKTKERVQPMPQLSDKSEEILEHLWITIEERKEPADLGLSRDDDELRILQEGGLISIDGHTAELTPTGREEARRCVRRHRLAERLLSDILAGGDSELHEASCKFEHGLHRGLEERVCTILGHPKTCPHGKPIPPGDCCRRMEKEAGQLILALTGLKAGETAVIAYLHSEDVSDLRKLMAIGALPGTQLTLRQRFPSYLLEMGHSQFAIDEEMARQIYVRRAGV